MSDRKIALIAAALFMASQTIMCLLFNTNSLFLAIVGAVGAFIVPLLISLLIYAFRRKGFCITLSTLLIITGVMGTAGAFIEKGLL